MQNPSYNPAELPFDPSSFPADTGSPKTPRNTDKVKHRHKTAYVPFTAGSRMCIRFNFALEEVRVIVSMLVYRYRIEKVGSDLDEEENELAREVEACEGLIVGVR
ncbi:hypothetical protein BDZ45DRAFT_743406 [Acephala macrosclerotiorum]|nr:hypothetical protein BDZ45DRAFT_743406 [Acephala macrosclerotiorum]